MLLIKLWNKETTRTLLHSTKNE